MKNKLRLRLLCLILFILVRVGNASAAVTSVSISNCPSSAMEAGTNVTLSATILPDTAKNKGITWSSSDPTIANVNAATGVVSAVKTGTATITVTTADGGKTATCNITVKTSVTSVAISNCPSSALEAGTSTTLLATVSPANADNKNVGWSSSNTSAATVDASTGKITAVASGTSIITVTTSDGNKTATCNITVKVSVTSVALDVSTFTMYKNDTRTLVATVNPANATNKAVSWSSSNTNIATVNNTGMVTAVARGTATITVTTVDGNKTASGNLTVKVLVSGVTLNTNTANIFVGNNMQLTATVSPNDASDKRIAWNSDNTAAATVDSTGLVKAVADGTATITVTTIDGNKTANCVATITTPVTGVSLNITRATIGVNDVVQLSASVQPVNATNNSITWKSGNTTIATVSNEGLVMAKQPGIAVITVTTVDGNKTATCTITVPVGVLYVTLNVNDADLNIEQTLQLTPTVHPGDATTKTVNWWSDLPTVADVSSTGLVTALTVGTAKIIVRTTDGNNTDTCIIKVVQPVTGITITMNTTKAFIITGDTLKLTATVKPDDATDKRITWSSDNTAIATINSMGLVIAKSVGTAIITATGNAITGTDPKKGTITITVYLPGEGITLDKDSVSLVVSNSVKLTAQISPPTAHGTTIIWRSSVPQVATVDNSGTVNAVAVGVTKIFATINTHVTKDSLKTDSCEVYVFIAATKVAFETNQIDLAVGMQDKLNASVFPPNATNRIITWTSSDPSVVSVNNIGYIVAHGIGTAKIIVTAADGQMKDTCDVRVYYVNTSVETASDQEFTISPNPFNGSNLTIKLKQPSNDVKIRIFDVLGRVIYQNAKLSGSEINIQPAFGHGIYMILIESGNDRYLTKIIVP